MSRFPAALATALVVTLACRPLAAPIRIGLAGPLGTREGAAVQQAARLAVTEINAAGGVRGRPLLLVERDDRNDLDSAVAVAAGFAAGEVVAVVGHVSPALSVAAAPLYRTGPTPVALLVPSTAPPDLTTADHVFRLAPADSAHGAALAGWARRDPGFERAAILYHNDSYGRSVRQAFATRFTVLGGTVVSNDPYVDASVGAYLDRITARGDADVLVLADDGPVAEAVLRLLRDRGNALPVLGGDGLAGVETLGDLAQGLHLTAAYHPANPTPANQAFVLAFVAGSPDAASPTQTAATTYDAIHLLRVALADGGATRRGVLEALRRIGSVQPPFQGVTGILSFTDRGDLARFPLLIGVVRDGVVDVVERR